MGLSFYNQDKKNGNVVIRTKPQGVLYSRYRLYSFQSQANYNGTSAGGSYTALAELILANEIGGDTIAPILGGTATAAGNRWGSPYKAFDGIYNPTVISEQWSHQNGGGVTWIQFDFGTPTRLLEYGVQAAGYFANGDSTPANWEFQAWDGSNFITLDSQGPEIGWSQGEIRRFTLQE